MKQFLLFLIAFILTLPASAQSILQDNKGQTALNLNPGKEKVDKDSLKSETIGFGLGLIKFSTSEKKLELNYYQYFRPDNKAPSFLGISASGEIDNSFSSLFSSGDIAPGATLKIRYGKRLFKRSLSNGKKGDYPLENWERDYSAEHSGNSPSSEEIKKFVNSLPTSSDLWLVMNTGLTGSKFKLYYPDSAFASQIQKKTFTAPEFNIGLNYWSANVLGSVALIGATIGAKKVDNFDDLTEVISEETTTNTLASSTRKLTEKNTVYEGTYKEMTSYPLKLDIYFKPHKFQNVAFLIYDHTEYFRMEKSKTRIGAGVYFLRKNDLFNPVFGINIDYSDVANNYASQEKSGFSRLNVGFVTNLSSLLFQKKG